MIEIRNLTKRFAGRVAVDQLNLHVPQGSIFGLLGHNGAGKSTTLGMLLGQVFPDEGNMRIEGFDVFAQRAAALRHVGAIYEAPAFYDYLSGRRNLQCLCALSHKAEPARVEQVIELVGLKGRIDEPVARYSHGMRQRLALAQALLPDPKLLILDEPSDGLDPEGMREMRQLIVRLNREMGLTIVFSSHLLNEVEQVCTHLAVMRQAKLLYTGPWSPMTQSSLVELHAADQVRAMNMLRERGMIGRQISEHRAEVTQGATTTAMNRLLVGEGIEVEAITPARRTLEEFYLDLVATPGSSTLASAGTAADDLSAPNPKPQVPGPKPLPPLPAGSFLTQFALEMFKLAARKRSWIGFGAFFAVQTAILLMLQLPQAQRAVGRMLERNGYGFEGYYGGLTLAVVIIGFTFLLLGALYIALVGGDIVAKEVEDGTMRMLLARPVSRLRVLATKWLACVSYTFLLTAFLALTALAVATIYRSYVGKLFVFIPEEGLFAVFDTAEGLVRYARAMGFLSFNIITIASLAFMFSCFRMKPAAATILTLSVLFVDLVLRNIPYFKSYEMYFITYHIAAWARTFRDPVLWPGIIQSMTYLTGLNLTLFTIGATGFGVRDLKN